MGRLSKSPGTKKKANTRARSRTPKGVRSPRRPGQRATWSLWFVLALAAVCLAVGFLVGHRALPPRSRPPVLPLSQKAQLVDLVVKGQLYMFGLSKGDVIGQEAAARERGKRRWTETTTRIQLPRAIPSHRILTYLTHEIGTLGEDFSVTQKRDDGGVLEIEIRVEDVVAHHLFFYEPKVAKPEIPPKGQIAIVIDDLGHDKRIAMDLLELEGSLSFSVFPFAPHAREVARRASREGRDVLLHLPMEPKGYTGQGLGEGGLMTTMDRQELLAQLEKDLAAIPGVKGVNNHMGSKFTEDPERMRIVLEDLKEKGLFFLDSRTTPHTVGFKIAQKIGLKTGQRSVFIDNERDVSKIKARISELIELSHKNRGAIGIGHPHPETVQALREMLPSFEEDGVALVPVSSLLE